MKKISAIVARLEALPTSTMLWLLCIVSFCVYFRVFVNGFAGDDIGYINHPYIQQFQFLKLFQSSSADLGGTSPITGQFFRPLMLVLISLIYRLVGDQAFLYHFIQYLLHLVNGILLMFVLRNWFSRVLAFVLSLVFLVHPINVETVVYVSDFQDVLFLFFGLLAVSIMLYRLPTKQVLVSIMSLLVLSLLSKETGMLFLPIIWHIGYGMKTAYKTYLPLLLIIPLLLYSYLRIIVAGVLVGHVPHTVFGSLNLTERFVQVPSLLQYYFVTVFYPKTLSFGQTWTVEPTIRTVVLPLVMIILLVSLLIMVFVRMYKKNKILSFVGMLFGYWLFFGLLLHIQLLPLEMTVADRWFYFPFIGLLGLLGVIMQILPKSAKSVLILVLIISIPLLGIRSVIRIGDWHDSYTLYSHDRQYTQSYLLENSYGYELMQRNDLTHAYLPLKRSVDMFETTNNTNSLGVYYFKSQDMPHAIQWMERSIELGDNFLAYSNVARILMAEKNYPASQKILERATKKFPDNPSLWYLLALTYYKNGDTIGALSASERAYTLSPTRDNSYVYTQLRTGKPILITE